MRCRRQDAGDLTNRLYWYAAHLTKALQKPVQDGSLGIVSGFTGESCRVPIKAERSGTRKIPAKLVR